MAGATRRALPLDTSRDAVRQTRMLRSLALLLLLIGSHAQAACRVEAKGTVPLGLSNGHILVTVQVNDVDATFILDTGAERTLMSEDAVRQLGLERDGWVATAMRGIGGVQQRPNALPRSLRLGMLTLRRKTVTGDTSVTVGPLPVSELAGRPIVGLLGRDFVAPFDLDMDLPGRRVTLYDVRGCDRAFLPWSAPYAALQAATPVGTALVVQVTIDGRPLRALIDSGAGASLITAPGMFRLGLTADILSRDPVGTGAGIGPAAVPMRHHRFAEMRIGPELIHSPALWVAEVRVVPIVDMLLGADWFSSRRVWLSFATKQVFVAARRDG
jgi:hypothetical protein